ncbi:MAG: MFS transporter [Spirochaetes bacterium]|nr:MFS transporter [Spirochaetota bacterium]
MISHSANPFRSLKVYNFRVFFIGQFVSLIGTWIQQLASSWLMYRLTASSLWLGLLAFSAQLPIFILTPVTGVVADRYNRHNILMITQMLLCAQSLLLGLLVVLGYITPIWLLALNIMQGLFNAFDMPVRQSFVFDMVAEKELLSNAIALNSVVFNSTRLIGPPLAGFLVAQFGEGVCFLINTVTFSGIIVALLLMKNVQSTNFSRAGDFKENIIEGFIYVKNHYPIRTVLLLLALISLLGMPFMVLMPVVAVEILHGDSHTLGFLLGTAGLGALCGALFVASRSHATRFENNIAVGSLSLGCALVFFSFSRNFYLSLGLMFIIGISLIVQMASSNTFIQSMVEDSMRGRVMSLYTMSFMGMATIGNLFAGAIAQHIGVQYTLLLSGMGCTVVAAMFFKQLHTLKKILITQYSYATKSLKE